MSSSAKHITVEISWMMMDSEVTLMEELEINIRFVPCPIDKNYSHIENEVCMLYKASKPEEVFHPRMITK